MSSRAVTGQCEAGQANVLAVLPDREDKGVVGSVPALKVKGDSSLPAWEHVEAWAGTDGYQQSVGLPGEKVRD